LSTGTESLLSSRDDSSAARMMRAQPTGRRDECKRRSVLHSYSHPLLPVLVRRARSRAAAILLTLCCRRSSTRKVRACRRELALSGFQGKRVDQHRLLAQFRRDLHARPCFWALPAQRVANTPVHVPLICLRRCRGSNSQGWPAVDRRKTDMKCDVRHKRKVITMSRDRE
jgi:hypothetical protein